MTREIISITGQRYTIKGKELKPQIAKNGYHTIKLSKNGVSNLYYIHILVANSYVKKPKRKAKSNVLIVNHKDGNKSHNESKNLEWVTYSENNQHAYDNDLHHKGEKHYNSKLTEDDVRIIKKAMKDGKPTKQFAKVYGVSRATVRDIVRGKTWKHIII